MDDGAVQTAGATMLAANAVPDDAEPSQSFPLRSAFPRLDCGSTCPGRRGYSAWYRRAFNDAWLTEHDVVPVNYGDNLPARLHAAAKSGHIDALLDFFGGGYVTMAIEELGLPPEKINIIADFEAVKRFGVQSKGGADAATAAVLAELANMIARGELEVPIAGVFTLDEVRAAFRQLELRHTRGKLVFRL